MIENGNNESLNLLKQAILDEADKYLKSNKLNLTSDSNQSNEQQKLDNSLIASNEDLSKTILKIDEFLENLDKSEHENTSRNDTQQNAENRKSEFEQISFVGSSRSLFSQREENELTTSSSFCSEDSSISRTSMGTNSVKSILKQKLLETVAQKVNTKESEIIKN